MAATLPAAFLAAIAGRDELLVTSRAGSRTGTVRMSFAAAPPGVVYLLTSAFSRKVQRWERDGWARLTVPGTGISVEAVVRRVVPDQLDAAARVAVLERFATGGAATAEALRELLASGTHVLFRVEAAPPTANRSAAGSDAAGGGT